MQGDGRVNAVASEWFADDINGGVVPEVAAIVVPKIDSVDALNTVSAALEANGLGHIGVIAGIETALGVADARLLLAHERVIAAYFGAEDFIADMGGIRTASNEEVLRGAVALAARLGGVPLLDQVVTDFRDDDRFIAECAQARAIGYSGKLCIHPGQVALANAAFIPSADEVDRARRLLEVYENATSEGLAAIDFEGQMVDEPLAVQARRIIATADE